MRKITARASLLAVLLIASAAVGGIGVGSAAAETVALNIKVQDQSGSGVGGATLTLTWDGGSKTVTTVSTGEALVDVPANKTITVTVDAPEHVRNKPFVIENPTKYRNSPVVIPVHENALATVTVKNTQGPVQNAEVNLVKNGIDVIEGKTGPNGKIESGEIEVGTYKLTVRKSGYLTNTTTLDVRGHVKPTVTIEQASVTAEINVVDPYFEPPRPLENVTVKVGSIGTVQTLSNGEATIQVPVNSKPKVTISKPGYKSKSIPLLVEESPTRINLTLSRVPSLTLKPSADRVITGENVTITITDEYGDLVPNATVSLNGETIGTTNAQGMIEVPIQSAGKQTIRATAKGASESITIEGFNPDAEDTTTPTPTPTQTATSQNTTTTDGGDTGSAFGPGFGLIAALLALLATAFLAGRRR